jgi:Transposase IS116/IS110/IS902 family
MSHYGIGPVTATSIVAELGDVSRLAASRKAVRCAGLDVGVHRSDQHSRLWKLTRQGSPQLRWALYEAAQSACKPRKPRPRRLPRTQGARLVAHQGDDDDRPQARPALLAQARPRRARTRHLSRYRAPIASAKPTSLDDTQASGQLPQVLRHPPTSGGPKKTERPESIPADRPIDHHVAGHQAVHPDKPGRPRNDRTHRNRKPSQPLTPQLDNGPGSDKQHAHPDRASPIDAEDDPPAIAERDPAAAQPGLRRVGMSLNEAIGLSSAQNVAGDPGDVAVGRWLAVAVAPPAAPHSRERGRGDMVVHSEPARSRPQPRE